MYVVSKSQDNRIMDLYDTEVYLDEGVEVFPITNEEHKRIWESGCNGDWRYLDGSVVYDPLPRPELPESAA